MHCSVKGGFREKYKQNPYLEALPPGALLLAGGARERLRVLAVAPVHLHSDGRLRARGDGGRLRRRHRAARREGRHGAPRFVPAGLALEGGVVAAGGVLELVEGRAVEAGDGLVEGDGGGLRGLAPVRSGGSEAGEDGRCEEFVVLPYEGGAAVFEDDSDGLFGGLRALVVEEAGEVQYDLLRTRKGERLPVPVYEVL